MTEREDPDQPTLDLLCQAIELHCRKQTGLGPDDAQEMFFTMAYGVWRTHAIGQWDMYVQEQDERIKAYQASLKAQS